jgi:hypothetical protein
MRINRVVLLAAGATVAVAGTLKSVARYRVKVVKTAQLGDKVNESASALSHPRRDADHNIQPTSPNNDNEDPSVKVNTRAKPSWQDNVGTIASALGIGGVAIYGILSLGYDRFYGNLASIPPMWE